MAYDIGDVVRVTETFTVNGTPTDPSTLTVKVKIPAGTITTYVYGVDAQVVRSSAGVFYVDVTPATPGTYAVRFHGTGAAAPGADEQTFTVDPSDVLPGVGDVATNYCTIAEARAAGATGSDEDVLTAIAIAMERVDDYTGEWFSTHTAASVLATTGPTGLILSPKRLQTVTSVTPLGGSAYDSTNYTVRTSATVGDIDAVEMSGYTPGQRVTVVGNFGWATTPKSVRRATALLAAQLRTNPTGSQIAGAKSLSVEGYSVTFGDGGSSTGLPEADELLERYRLIPVA